MRRTSRLALLVIAFLGVLLAGGVPLAAAQDTATPAAAGGHPLAGSWIVNTAPDNPDEPLSLANFTADGTYIEVDSDGGIALGAWEATGDTTANLTFSYVDAEGGMTTFRASIAVDPNGRSFTATYTLEFRDASGEWSGQIGPATAVGVRVVVDGPGTPVASFEDIMGGTPAATPAA